MAVECQNCGSSVSASYARVLAPNPEKGVRCCPWCPDLVRDMGSIREVRGTRRHGRGPVSHDA